MKILKWSVPALMLILGAGLIPTMSFGKQEYSKKEKKSCTYCHVKTGSKDLNDAGKYYKDHNLSLEGYQEKK